MPYVYTGWGTPEKRAIGAITTEELTELHQKGNFPPGSMGPKVVAACEFLERGGKRAIITDPETMPDALMGRGGTHIIGGC